MEYPKLTLTHDGKEICKSVSLIVKWKYIYLKIHFPLIFIIFDYIFSDDL